MSSKKTATTAVVVRERQKKLGPAPFASFEDMSDDLSSPESKGYQPMPEISEEQYRIERQTANRYANSSSTTSAAQTPTTPRIDVEQASSSPSTPERELFGDGVEASGVSSAFLEGAADVDLRSSAEEMMPVGAKTMPTNTNLISNKERAVAATPSTLLARSANAAVAARRKISWDAAAASEQQYGHAQLERKGSASRTADPFFFPSSAHDTRLSSISSNMSATSGMSALSSFSTSRRSPSPHRMQLETSFCGPKASGGGNTGPLGTESSDDVEDQELVDLCRKGRHNSGRGSSLMPNPLDYWPASTPSASPVPGSFLSASMVKYATEPRSRPTSPSPTPFQSQINVQTTATAAADGRWLASPRHQERRASSPHRTLVETSFCGSQKLKVPDGEDEVAPRGPSPSPSSMGGSLLNIQTQPFKYATEPRSRPASPTAANRSFLTPVPPPGGGINSRRGSAQSLRCSSPMIETSFCGAKQLMQRLDTLEQSSPPIRRPQEASNSSLRQSSSLRPVNYTTEPRSRPSSPAPMGLTVDSPKLGRRPSSPHRMVVETSFCGAKQQQTNNKQRQDSITRDASSFHPVEANPSINGSQISIHPLPVRYATEPRSRPVSPAPPPATGRTATPDLSLSATEFGSSRSMRSPSPHRMLVETSFCGARRERNNVEEFPPVTGSPRPQRKASATSLSASVAAAVKYSTEPRSRPVSPSPNLLQAESNHSTPDTARRVTRSPSPHRMILETSFVGTKQSMLLPREEEDQSRPPIVADEKRQPESDDEIASTSSPSSSSDDEDDSSAGGGSISEIPINRNAAVVVIHQPTVEDEEQQLNETGDWASEAGFNVTWPPSAPEQQMPLGEDEVSSTSIESPSPPSQKGNATTTTVSAALPTAATASPSLPLRQAQPGRNMPKPVACPKPPQSFTASQHQTSDSSTQNSPVGSPYRHRRSIQEFGSGAASETASPSPSSPFPSRKTSFAFGGFQRRESGNEIAPAELETAPGPTVKSDKKFGEQPTGKKEGKKGGVLSALFGKRSFKNKAGLTLPVQSRDPSPNRSATGDSADDLDDDIGTDQGFKHQMLETDEPLTKVKGSGGGKLENSGDAPGAGPLEPPKEEVSFIFHQDSIEEELPYVPTTLPIERPIAPLITPVRARIMSEVKTTPTERPRCSVTFAPRSHITDYVKIAEDPQTTTVAAVVVAPVVQKIRVYLPRLSEREESQEEEATAPVVPIPTVKVGVGSVKWEAFSGQVFLQSKRVMAGKMNEKQPAVVAAAADPTKNWINVEELPEPVKEPKAIRLVVTSGNKKPPTVGQQKNMNDVKPPPPSPCGGDKEIATAAAASRKDSVCSETALLREIDEPEAEEDRSPPLDDDDYDEENQPLQAADSR